MILNEREIKIFRAALEPYKKKIAKSAHIERTVLHAVAAFSELEDYIEHIERRIDAALSKEELVFSSSKDSSNDQY